MSFAFGPFTLLLLLCALWITSLPSLPQAPFTAQQTAEVDTTQASAPQLDFKARPLFAQPPNWRDALVLQLAITDSTIQQQRGEIMWKVASNFGRYPVIVVADGATHEINIPLGIDPAWSEIGGQAPLNLHLVFPHAADLAIHIKHASLIKRSPFAFDALLGRALMPALPAAPTADALILLTGTLFCFSLACTMPKPLRQKVPPQGVLVGALVLLCALSNANAVAAELQRLPLLWQRYRSPGSHNINDPALFSKLPHYTDSPHTNAFLAQAAGQLPSGRVLVITQNPNDIFFRARAHYLLFPRVVVFATAGQGQALNLAEVSSVIQPARRLPPKQGWQRVAGPSAGYEAWRTPNPHSPHISKIPYVGIEAWPGFVIGLIFILAAGFALAGALGWASWMRLACSLPFGAGIVALWMFLLSAIGIRWSAWNIGLPLLVFGVLGIGRMTRLKTFPNFVAHPVTISVANNVTAVAAIALFGLVLLLSTHAALVPFSDQDTWTTWGFNSRAFFTEANIQTALTKYAESGLSHASYPPALPLLQAWSFYSMGGISERLVKLVMPLWYLSLVVLVWAECRRWVRPMAASAVALLLATTPLLLDHATLGNADLPFTALLVAATIALIRWIETSASRWLINASALLVIGAWMKLDGLYLGLLLLLCMMASRSIALWQTHAPKAALIQTTLPVLGSVGGLMALYAGWTLFTRTLHIKGEMLSLALLRVSGLNNFLRGWADALTEMLFSHTNSTWGLLGGGYGLLWVIGLGAVALGWRKLRTDAVLRFLMLGVAGTVAFYVCIYAVRPFFSMERYLMHAAPLVLLAAARTYMPKTQSSEAVKV